MHGFRLSIAAALSAVALVFPGQGRAQVAQQYLGQMQTTFQISDYGSPGQSVTTNVRNILVSIQSPYQIPPQYAPTQGTGDTNPFFLFISEYPKTATPGAVSIISASPQVGGFTPGQPSSRWVLQSWKLTVDGTSFRGEFISPFSVDVNNYFVSMETNNPLAFNPWALANGGNPFTPDVPVPCIAFLSQPTTLAGTVDNANGRISISIDGHGGGYTKGLCMADIRFHADIVATYDPTIPAPQPQIAPQILP